MIFGMGGRPGRETMGGFAIRRVTEDDRCWVRETLTARWGSSRLVSRGRLWCGEDLEGFVADDEARGPVGLTTMRLGASDCELVSLDSLSDGRGVGMWFLLTTTSI